MTDTPWSSREVLNRLSRESVGPALASRVAARLVKDAGRKGIWNSHRDYCGHGLIYRESQLCLVQVHDGLAKDGLMVGAWNSEAEFAGWLARQSDYSLSGAEPGEALLYTSNPSQINNQRLTRVRLEEYASGQAVLPVFRDYLTILDSAFAFLVEEFGFEKATPQMAGHECAVVYRLPSRAAIHVIWEPFSTPHLLLTLHEPEPGTSFSNQPLVALARQRAPDWRPPRFGRDAEPDDSNLFDCFAHYETLLRDHFMDVLVPTRGVPASEAPVAADVPPDAAPAGPQTAPSSTRVRMWGGVIALGALVVMFAELRYFSSAGTPDATGSVHGNLGLLILMGLPWVVFIVGLLQAFSGIDIRRYDAAFSNASLPRRLSIAFGVILAATVATVLVFSFV